MQRVIRRLIVYLNKWIFDFSRCDKIILTLSAFWVHFTLLTQYLRLILEALAVNSILEQIKAFPRSYKLPQNTV